MNEFLGTAELKIYIIMDIYVYMYAFLRSRIEFEPSYVKCEDLYPSGRMSFKNFNPTVEVSILS